MNKKAPRTRRGRMPTEGLTPAQEKVMHFIRNMTIEKGYPPTAEEVGEEMGTVKSTVLEHFRHLERKGYIRRTRMKSRSIEILKSPPVGGFVPVPIVGDVAAGSPILAQENIVGEILVEEHFAKGTCFALSVIGDSMIDARINEGDYIIVRQQPIAENGDIVVALIDDEATVKRLHISGHQIELRPENKKYKPIKIGQGDQLLILGKVTAIRSPSQLQEQS
ncbi:MAG: transcriptional repressor LexA [Magnetococcales bacterium]|nr:transcriptional repressor LexA [Magnetococcales bacterium]